MGSGSSLVTIAAVGDIMLGSDWPTPRLPTRDLLRPVAPLLRDADIAFGNLEGVLADGGTVRPDKADPRRHFAFRTPARYALWLERAGLDVLSVANNHAGDFQAAGRAATLRALRAHHLTPVGGPGVLRATKTVHGVPVTFLGFSTGGASPNLNRIDAARALVEKARRRGGIVVVSFHGGAEGAAHQHVPHGKETFRGEARGDLRQFTHALIDSGADLLLGHGPHVLRGLEVYRRRLIAYSLGNFATYGRISIRGASGVTAVLSVTLAKNGALVEGRIHPCVQTGEGGPRPDPKRRAIRLLQRLSAQDFGHAAAQIGADGRLSP